MEPRQMSRSLRSAQTAVMTTTMALYIMLPCLVAVVAAAPAADRTDGHQEPVVGLRVDGMALSRAKRAQEQVVFGNQQNGAMAPASASKKNSGGQFLYPPFVPRLPPSFSGEATPYKFTPQADDKQDKAGFMYASKQTPLKLDLQEETASELQAAMVPETSGPKKEGEAEEQKETPAPKSPAESEVNSNAESMMGQKEPPQQKVAEVGEQSEHVEQAPVDPEPHPEAQTSPPTPTPPAVAAPEVHTPQRSRLPEDSRRADAEEALHAKDQNLDTDNIELFLEDLKKPMEAGETGNMYDKEEEKHGKEDAKEEEKQKAEAGSAEAELMQIADKGADAPEKAVESENYRKQLLKYILMNEDEYGRVPVGFADYPYPGSYFLQRRRRSPVRSRLPHIHRRRRSGRKVGRARRTKRDLFDDELYYNPDAQYALQGPDNQEEEEKQAEIGELISYLMALYPALYDNRPPLQSSPYPGYFWYRSGYPEETYPDYPQLEEEPEYMDVPANDWEPPSQPVPAWEPAFYPEEVEEPSYYPSLPKRQMIPEQRLKRYFYPNVQEPYAHWGAFVPSQKRDYDDAYWRIKDLAMVLADARQPYVDALSDYRK